LEDGVPKPPPDNPDSRSLVPETSLPAAVLPETSLPAAVLPETSLPEASIYIPAYVDWLAAVAAARITACAFAVTCAAVSGAFADPGVGVTKYATNSVLTSALVNPDGIALVCKNVSTFADVRGTVAAA